VSQCATQSVERSLGAAELGLLRSMLGNNIADIYANDLHLNIETGRLRSWFLAFRTQNAAALIQLSTDWVQVGGDDFHALEVVETAEPLFIPVTIDQGTIKSVGPCSVIEVGRRGALKSIDVVSYDRPAMWCDAPRDDDLFSAAVTYDRALVLHFEQGEPLTLTTEHGSILGAFEIRSGIKPGFDADEGTFSTRVTLRQQ
jgi:hypothetical protein